MFGKKPKKERLATAINRLEDMLEREFLSTKRAVVRRFVMGIAYGLGVIFAVAIVLPIIIWSLNFIQWAPIVGDFATAVLERMEEAKF